MRFPVAVSFPCEKKKTEGETGKIEKISSTSAYYSWKYRDGTRRSKEYIPKGSYVFE